MKKLVSAEPIMGTIFISELVKKIQNCGREDPICCIAIKAGCIIKLCFIQGVYKWVRLSSIGTPNIAGGDPNLNNSLQELLNDGYSIYLFDSFQEYLNKHGLI
jgi:hypothetical protein